MSDCYRVTIERLENAFEVTVPDVPAMEKAEKAASKKSNSPSVYTGDMTKSYAAKTVKDALKIIETALKDIPASELDSAWEEAAAENE